MKLSDTTNKNGLLQDIERWCGMSDGHITGNTALKARFINDVNESKFYIESMIINSQDEFDYDDSNHTDFPIVTTPLTTSRDYRLNASERILKLKRLDVTYDGTNYYRATPIDSSEIQIGLGNDTHVDSNFSIQSPRYDVKYGSWFLYPKATQAQVDAGAQALIEWTREGVEFATDGTDDTVEPGFERAFHSLISKMVALEWLLINKNKERTLIQKLEDKLQKQMDLFTIHIGNKQNDRNIAFGTAEYLTKYR